MLKRTMERLERIETRLQMKHDYLPSLPDVSNDSFSEVYNGTEMESPNLINPEEVIRKYRSFVVPSKLPKLSVKLAREAFIGDNIMTKSTVQGQGSRGLQALPPDKLGKVQSVIKELSCPRFFTQEIDFEECWKSCLKSLGQACKNLRVSKRSQRN